MLKVCSYGLLAIQCSGAWGDCWLDAGNLTDLALGPCAVGAVDPNIFGNHLSLLIEVVESFKLWGEMSVRVEVEVLVGNTLCMGVL